MKNKIIVIGSPGSGKSYFSRELTKILDIPVYHMDSFYWRDDKTHVTRGELVGIIDTIGRNGRGKTTLLKLLSGELIPDKGEIKKDVKIEFFPYEYEGIYTNTFDIIKECIGNLGSMEEQLDNPLILQQYIELGDSKWKVR